MRKQIHHGDTGSTEKRRGLTAEDAENAEEKTEEVRNLNSEFLAFFSRVANSTGRL